MSKIYVLELENSKYYIGKTTNIDARMSSHFDGEGAEWTKLHKPKKLIEVVNERSIFDENNKTKEYMMKYGIDNVRGGTYCTLNINAATRKFLELEFASSKNVCYNCGEPGHFSKECTGKKIVTEVIHKQAPPPKKEEEESYICLLQ